MSALTPAMDTALAADNPIIFGALQIDLPGYALCLLDGAGQLAFNSQTFVGRDSTFGVLSAIDSLDDGFGDTAPAISITLLPSTDAAAATLADAAMQGSRVRLWIGAVTRATGAVIADPLLLFDGELDQPVLTLGQGKRVLEYECVSSMERLFDGDEGFRLSDANHQRIWPGETGLANMTGLTRKVYWGVAGPTGAASGNSPGSDGFSNGNAVGRLANRVMQ